jgi:hypothetical protein
MQNYEAQQKFWHRGTLIQPGDQLALTEREARYYLLNGDLKPVQMAIEAGSKKRGK